MTLHRTRAGFSVPTILALVLAAGLFGGPRPAAASNPQAVRERRAEPNTDKLALDPNWKVGDRVNYEVVKTQKRVRTSGANLDVTARTPLTVEVREATADAFLLACVFGRTSFDDPSQADNPLTRRLLEILREQTLLVDVQRPGVITGLRNWQEVKTNVVKASDLLLAEFEKTGADPKAVAAVRDTMASVIATRERIMQTTTTELGLLLLPIGHVFDGGKAIEVDDAIPSPLGGPPIPSKARLVLEGVSPAPRTAVVRWTQTVDPEAARQRIEAYIRDMAQKIGKPIPEGQVLPSLDIKDVAEYHVDVATAWVVELTHTRTIVVGDDSRTDTTTIRRTDTRK
jgi:hypothetical protein